MDESTDNVDGRRVVVWVGAVENDPFSKCAQDIYSVHPCDTLYEALACYLSGEVTASTMVANVRTVGGTLTSFRRALIDSCPVKACVFYCVPKGMTPYDDDVKRFKTYWADTPEQMQTVLAELVLAEQGRVQAQPMPVIQSEAQALDVWTQQPPVKPGRQMRDQPGQLPDRSDTEQPITPDDITVEEPFSAPRLSDDEMRALLGPQAKNGSTRDSK